MGGDGMTEPKRPVKEDPPEDVMASDAVAFMMEIGMCPGSACPLARDRCDPLCPALAAWVEGTSGG